MSHHDQRQHGHHAHEGGMPHGAGRSSVELFDTRILLDELGLRPGETFLDLGTGRGQYLFLASPYVGPAGRLIGIDLWHDGVREAVAEAGRRNLRNVSALHADLAGLLPLDDASVDAALLCVVLHDVPGHGRVHLMSEVRRVLKKPSGRLAVAEFRKIQSQPGPPLRMRLPAEEVLTHARAAGLALSHTVDLNESMYLLMLRPA